MRKEMKKAIILLFSLIAITGAVSAALPYTSTTDIGLNLSLYPKYLISVTTVAPKAEDTALQNVLDKVEMTYSEEDFTIQSTTETVMYISYIFSEYEKCHLEAKLEGPMKLSSTSTTNDELIQYEVEMVLNEDSSDKNIAVTGTQTLYSNTQNTINMINIPSDATMKGEKVYGSFSLVLNPSSVDGENTIIGKRQGSYSSSIVLSVVAD